MENLLPRFLLTAAPPPNPADEPTVAPPFPRSLPQTPTWYRPAKCHCSADQTSAAPAAECSLAMGGQAPARARQSQSQRRRPPQQLPQPQPTPVCARFVALQPPAQGHQLASRPRQSTPVAA